MKKLIHLSILVFLLAACSSLKTGWNPKKNAATEFHHQEILKELDSNFHREPASALNDLNVNFNDLRRVSPGKFQVFIFPKISAQNMKEVGHQDEYLGPPQVYEVSILAVNPCKQFITAGLFAKLKPKEAFPAELSQGRDCAILEITDKRLAGIDKALLKQDDQLSVRLFIDDGYRVHAVDHTLFETRNKNRVVRRIGESEDLSSGLSLFPMDLPSNQAVAKKSELEAYFSKRLDPVAKYQIQKRFSSGFSAPRCEGAVFSSKDPFGGNINVGWCRGMPWPSYSENRRFFSVTQPLSVR